MAELFKDRVFGTLASSLDGAATAVQLTAGHGARFGAINGGDYIRGALINSSGQIEIVYITARATDQLTVTRNAEGGGALTFAAGDRIECRVGPSSVANFAQVAHLQTNEKAFAVNTGDANDLAAVLPASTISALVKGMEVDVELTGANTVTNARLKVVLGSTDTGFKPIVKQGPSSAMQPIEIGDLPAANAIAKFHYNPDIGSWVLLNPARLSIPQVSKSVNYTLTLDDANKEFLHPLADNVARTFTIPSNAAVPFPIGTMLLFTNEVNALTIAIDADTLKPGTRTLGPGVTAMARKTSSTEWVLTVFKPSVVDHGTKSGNFTLDLSAAETHLVAFSAAATLTITASAVNEKAVVVVKNGGNAITLAGIDNNSPTLTNGVSKQDFLGLVKSFGKITAVATMLNQATV